MIDPWLPERLRADARYRIGEQRVHAAVVDAMTDWLDDARARVLGLRSVTAAADDPPVPNPADLDPAMLASFAAWVKALIAKVFPALAQAFGESFLASSRSADISPQAWQDEYLATVHDRLVIWPQGAFEEIRPELLEALSEAETFDQAQDRVGMVLGIDAPTRAIRADISEIDRKLADPNTDPAELAGLRGRRAKLWNEHDDSLGEWQWKARRIARTEIHGAIEGGTLGGAQASAELGGAAMYKRWLATSDDRTRHTHRVADGQVVKLSDPFQVGAAQLQHPGEAGGPPEEVINCRCTTLILDADEHQRGLQGPWGGRGVAPGSIRLGPDDPDDVATAVDKAKREQAGEVVDWSPITDRPDSAGSGADG